MSFAVNVTAATEATLGSPGHIYHYLRAMNPLEPVEPRRYPNRTKANRTNAYAFPQESDNLKSGLFGFETRQCSNPNAPSPGPRARSARFRTRRGTRTRCARRSCGSRSTTTRENVPAPSCKQQGPVTVGGKTTLYPQLAPSPTPPAISVPLIARAGSDAQRGVPALPFRRC